VQVAPHEFGSAAAASDSIRDGLSPLIPLSLAL
jgi:hypothetical protein